jgi:predicted nucleotidyltransferase
MKKFEPERMLAALERARVEHVVVGGVALMAHGVVRATLDLDLVADPGEANLDRLGHAIRSLGGVPYGEPDTQVTLELLARAANMRFETEAGQLDLLGADQYRRLYPDLRGRAITLDLDGVEVCVASRNDLIRLKAGTGRDRDLLDIGDLLALDE